MNLLVVNPRFCDHGMAESASLAGAPHAFHEAVIRMDYHNHLTQSNAPALHLPRHGNLSGEKRKSVEDESLDPLLDVQFKNSIEIINSCPIIDVSSNSSTATSITLLR